MSEPFRTAQPATAAPEAVTETPAAEPVASASQSKMDDLLATYAEEMGKPWAATYLDIADVWKQQPELKLEVETIEAFLKDQVSKGVLDNSIRAAKQYMKDIEKKAGLTGYEPTTSRIQKILSYIEFKKVVDS